MTGFPGGSAFALVQQITEGHVLVTDRTFNGLRPGQLDRLSFEIEKRLRGLRGDQAPADDLEAVRQRNRRIQRLNGVRMMLQTFRRVRRM